jgi:S-adenosylmethionine synthetase
MIEKVNPNHPDKIADRIAGALVDYCYTKSERPKCAFEVLIGHGLAHIIAETSVHISDKVVVDIVNRIAGKVGVIYKEIEQDAILSKNQDGIIKCGDNGIFKGVPISKEVEDLSEIAKRIYRTFPTDGKYILAENKLIVCQSNATDQELVELIKTTGNAELITNPVGYWTGGIDVDSGATNRKLGSDMGEAVTGGGLHGKDLSKADVSINIYAHLKAQKENKVINLCCAIGDETVDGLPYEEITEIAWNYITGIGGFESLAEWGIV